MVKKATKRKTRWRTLSIGDGGADTTDNGIQDVKQVEQSECLTSTSNTNLSTYNRKSSFHTTPFHQRNGDRNHYYRNSDKYPSQPHNRTQSHEENVHRNTSYPFKRRPFYQSSSSRYYNNISNRPNPSTNSRTYRSPEDTVENKENTTTKPLFNEDDYTRITTPRQDVLFKKGYLSRPKKTITPTVSTTVSVVSTEDSGTQSLSPEHCSSTPEIFDPDHPLMYPGFYDENGVFFFNPFMPNGFDPYDEQFIMMPYGGGSPISINPSEYCNNESTAAKSQKLFQKRNSVDSENSPDSPSSQNESASSTPAIDDTSNEPSQNDETPTESQSESDAPKVKDGEVTPNECIHNMPMPMQFYYPFMYGPPPFLPIDEYNGNVSQYANSYGSKYNRFKKRKRRPFKYGNSTGVSATTTDYSEDEDSIEDRLLDVAVQPNSNVEGNPCLTIAQCDEIISRTTLNTNVSEFVPRHLQLSPSQTTLNVEVEEFHPRNYMPTVQSNMSIVNPIDAATKDTIPKKMSTESRMVTILPRNATEKSIQPAATKTNRIEPKQLVEKEEVDVHASPAIDEGSTLISSISTRDNNDDNVNGVDNNKKIEKLVDPVNIKADLDVKAVVMHPQQQENNLENVKKTKFKSPKANKSSPRKTNGGSVPKKDGKIGKGAGSSIMKCENVPVTGSNEHPQPLESKANDVVDRKVAVNERIEKSASQPTYATYAQMLGPVVKPKANIAKVEVVVVANPIQDKTEPIPVGESKTIEAIDDIKPAAKVETIWQTVRPKGKKKLFAVVCDELNDEWNDVDDIQPVEVKVVKETSKVTETQINEPMPSVDESTVPSLPAKVKPPKTEKAKLKMKAKKSQKKIKEKLIKSIEASESEATPQPKQNGTSTPKSDKMRSDSVAQIMDDLFVDGGHEFLNDIDISNFSFDTSPSMFVNAITNSGIYTDNSLTGKSSAGFSLNNSLKLSSSFDFCKTKGNALLKEEEEMVIRLLQSLNQTDSQVVKDDVKCHTVDNVKLNDSYDDVVNDHSDTHSGEDYDDDVNSDKKMETIGAEIIDVKFELNGNDDKLNENVNGHRHEEISCKQEDPVNGQLQSDANQEIEPITNGNHLNGENHDEEVDVNEPEEQNGHQIEDINIMPDIDERPIETKSKVDPITNGNHWNGEMENGGEIDVIAHEIIGEMCMEINGTSGLDVTNIADEIETEQTEMVDENEEIIREDCTTNIKSDDEGHSELSELSDENDETVVSQSNDYFEYDEIDTIREIDDVAEFVDDLQFDDDNDDFAVDNDNEMNIRNEEKGLKPLNDINIQELSGDNEPLPQPISQNIFIENEAILLSTEITLNDIEDTKSQDRIQSPRSSEDSGILEYPDDGKYFSESDNEKTEQQSAVQSFPLTEAVSRWLEEKQKEKSPEPVIRLPDDPELSQRIEKSIMSRIHITQFFDDYEDETSEESDTEFEVLTASKNLLSNPLRVLFRKQNDMAASKHSSNGIRKRVANVNAESEKSSIQVDEPDILEYWENDPMLQTQNANVLNMEPNAPNGSSSIDTALDAYESVYGKSVDYANLSANIHNDDVFLSNNILNNDKLSKLPISPIINSNSDSSLPQASSISGKNATNSIDKNLNCFKPPEICCMLM